jgi:hypothetical protein
LKGNQPKTTRLNQLFFFSQASLLYQLSKYIMIMWVKCEVGCEKVQLSLLLGKSEMTFRTTQYIVFFVSINFIV